MLQNLNPDIHLSLIVGASFLALVVAGYYILGIDKRQQLQDGEEA